MQDFQLTEAFRLIRNMVNIGQVIAVHVDTLQCRVRIGELDTAAIPVVSQRAGRTSVRCIPSVGEQVLVFAPQGDLAQAVILGSLHSDSNPEPQGHPDSHIIEYEDGTRIEHDVETGNIVINSTASVTINATGNVIINADGQIYLGDQNASKPIARIGDKVAVGSGSSAGQWPIVEGSSKVKAS